MGSSFICEAKVFFFVLKLEIVLNNKFIFERNSFYTLVWLCFAVCFIKCMVKLLQRGGPLSTSEADVCMTHATHGQS